MSSINTAAMKVKDLVPSKTIAKPLKKKAKLRSPDANTEDPVKRFAAERRAIKRVKNNG